MAGTQQDPLAAALPLDDQPDMQALLRKRAVMQALLQNAIGPQQGQMVSGHYIAPSLLGNLARMATGYYANEGLKGVDAQEREMTQKYNAGMGRAAKQYMDLRTGTQDEPMGPPTADDQWGLQKGQPANPRAAIVAAMTSGYKPLQQIATADLQSLGKQEAGEWGEPKTEIDPKTGKTIVVRYSKTGPRMVVPGAMPDREQWESFVRGGKNYRRNLQTGREELVDTGTNVNVDTKGATQGLEAAKDQLEKIRTSTIAAKELRDTSTRIFQALQDPEVQTGFGANVGTGLAAVAKKLGMQASPEKTQALVTDLAKNVLANASALKPLSDTDIKFLQQVTAGNAALDAQTLQHVAGLMFEQAHNRMLDNAEQHSSIGGIEGAGALMKVFPLPKYGTTALPEGFDENIDGAGRIKWRSPVWGAKPAAPASKSAPKVMTLEEAKKFYGIN